MVNKATALCHKRTLQCRQEEKVKYKLIIIALVANSLFYCRLQLCLFWEPDCYFMSQFYGCKWNSTNPPLPNSVILESSNYFSF